MKLLVFVITAFMSFSLLAEIKADLRFEDGIIDLTEGDPLVIELSLSSIPTNTRVGDKVIGLALLDSLNITEVLSEERKDDLVVLKLNSVLFKKFEHKDSYKFEIPELGVVDLHIPKVEINVFDKRKEEITIMDQPYYVPWNWKIISFVLLLLLMISGPFISHSLRRYRKLNLDRKKKSLEINKIETLIQTAKDREAVESAGNLLRSSEYVVKDNKINEFLAELEKTQYRKNWSSEELRIHLSRLKEIKVI